MYLTQFAHFFLHEIHHSFILVNLCESQLVGHFFTFPKMKDDIFDMICMILT